MPKWSDPLVRQDVIRLAGQAASIWDHVRLVREYFKEPAVTDSAIDNAWRRWRKDFALPARFDVINGAEVKQHADGPPAFESARNRPTKSAPTAPEPLHDHVIIGEMPANGTIIITSDHHHPISDKYAEAAVVAMARDIKPFAWVFNGDVLDAWSMSSFEKEAGRLVGGQTRVVDEVDSFKPLGLEAARICRHVWIGEGNHEQRLSRTINGAPGLHGLPGLEWASIFGLPKNVRFLSHGYRLQLGPVQVMHGDKVNSKHPAQWALDNHGARSVVFGHTHRISVAYKTTWEEKPPRTVVAINCGHLSLSEAQQYAFEPNWQTGFVVLHYWTHAGKTRYTAYPIHISDGRFAYGGRLYDGHKSQ